MKNPRIFVIFVLVLLCSQCTQAQNIWSFSPSVRDPLIQLATVVNGTDPNRVTDSRTTSSGNPTSLAIDTSGRFVFFSSSTDNIIRRIDLIKNEVKTIAGKYQVAAPGCEPCYAQDTRFNYPSYITIDKNNNLYVADANNNVVKKIRLSDYYCTVVAGNRLPRNYGCVSGDGYPDGDGAIATTVAVNYPMGIATDKYGDLYIGEWGSSHTEECISLVSPVGSRIWKLTVSTGRLSVVAGFDGVKNSPYPIEYLSKTVSSYNPKRIIDNVYGQFAGLSVDDSMNIFFTSGQKVLWKLSRATGKLSHYAGYYFNLNTGSPSNYRAPGQPASMVGFDVVATQYELGTSTQTFVDTEGDLFLISSNKVLKINRHSKKIVALLNSTSVTFDYDSKNGLPASQQVFGVAALSFDKRDSVYITGPSAGRILAGSIKGGWRGSDYDFCKNTNWDNNVVPVGAMNALIPAILSPNPWPIITCNVTLSNLRIKAGGILEIASGGSLTADVITIEPGGSLIGKGNVNCSYVYLGQKLLPQRGWRVFANPFSTPKNIQENANINFIRINTSFRYPNNPTLDTRIFNNSTNNWTNFTDANIASTTNHAIFIRGTQEEATRETYTSGPSGMDYYSVGSLLPLNSTVTIPAPANANNFSLTGNPFAAPITSMALTGGVRRAYYVYQIDQGSTDADKRTKRGGWSPVLLSDTVTTIPVLGVIQWKQPAGTFNVTTNDLRPRGTPVSNYISFEKQLRHLELAVTDSADTQDKLFVSVDPLSTDKGTDFNDLEKINNTGLNIYTIAEDKTHLAVDTRSNLNTRIPLGITAENGTYNLLVNNNNLPEGTTVYLNDNFEHRVIDLTKKSKYSFSVNSQNESKGDNRFSLQISQNKSTAYLNDDSNRGFKVLLFKNKQRAF
jgi:hypothetical protein